MEKELIKKDETVTISKTEYEQMKQQINWLTEQLVTINKKDYVTKSEAFNEFVEQLSFMPNANFCYRAEIYEKSQDIVNGRFTGEYTF